MPLCTLFESNLESSGKKIQSEPKVVLTSKGAVTKCVEKSRVFHLMGVVMATYDQYILINLNSEVRIFIQELVKDWVCLCVCPTQKKIYWRRMIFIAI